MIVVLVQKRQEGWAEVPTTSGSIVARDGTMIARSAAIRAIVAGNTGFIDKFGLALADDAPVPAGERIVAGTGRIEEVGGKPVRVFDTESIPAAKPDGRTDAEKLNDLATAGGWPDADTMLGVIEAGLKARAGR